MDIDWDSIGEEFKDMIEDMPELDAFCFADNSGNPYGVPLLKVAALLLILHASKDAQYGSSWARNGEFGVMLNLKRKEDRLDQLAALSACDDSSQYHVALMDTLADRSVYGMMWMSYIARHRPHAFSLWLEQVWCPCTGITYEEIATLIGLEE